MFKKHRTYSLTTGIKAPMIAVFADQMSIQVLLHSTVVVEASLLDMDREYSVVVRNGGWDTISTRIVINRALEQIPGFHDTRIVRHKGETMVQYADGSRETFASGMTLKRIVSKVAA